MISVGDVLLAHTTSSDEPLAASVVAVERLDCAHIPIVVMRRWKNGTVESSPAVYRLAYERSIWIWTHRVGIPETGTFESELLASVLECRLHAMRALERGEGRGVQDIVDLGPLDDDDDDDDDVLLQPCEHGFFAETCTWCAAGIPPFKGEY